MFNKKYPHLYYKIFVLLLYRLMNLNTRKRKQMFDSILVISINLKLEVKVFLGGYFHIL